MGLEQEQTPQEQPPEVILGADPGGTQNPEPEPVRNFDDAFKELFTVFLQEMIKEFAPELYEKIDWDRMPEFLNTILRDQNKLFTDEASGNIIPDCVARLFFNLFGLASEEIDQNYPNFDSFVVHSEFQLRKYGGKIKPRMMNYRFTVCDILKTFLIYQFLFLVGDDANWVEEGFYSGVGDQKVNHNVRVINLMKLYKDRLKELIESDNPIHLAIWSLIMSHYTLGNAIGRWEAFWKAVYRLLNFYEEHIINLNKFRSLFAIVDRLLPLRESQQQEFRRQFNELIKERNMPLVSNFEKFILQEGFDKGEKEGFDKGEKQGFDKGKIEGRNEGRNEGIQQGYYDSLVRTLRIKYPTEYQGFFGEFSSKRLRLNVGLLDQIEAASSLDQIRKMLSAVAEDLPPPPNPPAN